ncbi:MAG: CHAD domain-containing protein [Betaproteobacteria bacterium]|nr:CHAD domain-containing protein [Betaproteobacteria bacterium]NDF04102.1 CHAD domain-containing protein [Betaproteobacteria bacterium]
MTVETEICLHLPDACAARLSAWPLLNGHPSRRQQLRAIYFDTPQGHLCRAGAGLRVRRESGAWVQTLKLALSTTDRSELNQTLASRSASAVPMLSEAGLAGAYILDPRGGRAKLALTTLFPSLAPVFETRVRRRSWLVSHQGSVVEVSLDLGEVCLSDGRSRDVSECELELKEGQPAALWQFALDLLSWMGEGPLLEPRSKAERGYGLVWAQDPSVVPPQSSNMKDSESLAAALRLALSQASSDLSRSIWMVLESEDAEGPHQLRVAARRLRSVLKMVLPSLSSSDWQQLALDAKWIAGVAGPLRDRDVVALDILEPLMVKLPSDQDLAMALALLADERDRCRVDLRAQLKSVRAQAFLARLGLQACASLPALEEADARSFAQMQLKRLVRRVRQRKLLADQSPEYRHELRLAYKALRYASSWLEGLGMGSEARRQQRKAARAQKTLGDSQDAVMALPVLQALLRSAPPGQSGRVLGLVQGWLLAKQG